jgi:hypothetical protein
MDGNGGHSYVTINTNTGQYGYPGSTNMVGIASAGSTTYNGGDALVEFRVSTVGHVTPYVVQNACSDKSCYYGARLHTSQHMLELAKRSGNVTNILASVSFTANANILYWTRLHVSVGTGSTTLQAKVWANGTAEPGAWMVTATDTSPLASNLVGTGGSWDQTGTGESISYVCYAFATSGLAHPCTLAAGPTATPIPTNTSGPTVTPTPTNTSSPAATPTSTPSAATTTPVPGTILAPAQQGNMFCLRRHRRLHHVRRFLSPPTQCSWALDGAARQRDVLRGADHEALRLGDVHVGRGC